MRCAQNLKMLICTIVIACLLFMLKANAMVFDVDNGSVIEFRLSRHLITGLYQATIQVGSPPRELNAIIDTGSDISWFSCQTPSSSARDVSCKDHICKDAQLSCGSTNSCNYTINYLDKSFTNGHIIYDVFKFNAVPGGSSTATLVTANISFGCSNNQSGKFMENDGLFGLSANPISILSQLNVGALSHCLKDDEDEERAGIMVFGEIHHPDMVYTPLHLTNFKYNVHIKSIEVNGEILPIDPKGFQRETIMDTGSNYGVLANEIHEQIFLAINRSAPPQEILSTGPNIYGFICYVISITSSIEKIFPQVTLKFAGGSSMVLNSNNYMFKDYSTLNTSTWCFAFLPWQDRTILGDIILKDRIVVYDIAKKRFGWTSYNCSLPVTATSKPFHSKSTTIFHQKNINANYVTFIFIFYILALHCNLL